MNSQPESITITEAADLRVWQWLRALSPTMEDQAIAVLGDLTADQTTYVAATGAFADAKNATLTLIPDANRNTSLPTSFRSLAVSSSDTSWLAELEAEFIETFPNTPITWMTQSSQFPFTCSARRPYMGERGTLVVGAEATPWPTLGIVIPSVVNAGGAMLAAVNALKTYPGPSRVAIVTNNATEEATEALQAFTETSFGLVQVLTTDSNSYASAANRGMEQLNTELTLINADDTVVGPTTLVEMVRTIRETTKSGATPGIVGPKLSNVTGDQATELTEYATVAEMGEAALTWYETHNGTASQALDLRGDLLMITSACRTAVGGFDPKFALGYWEVEDYLLRARLAGFSSWIAEGAYAHHTGIATFSAPELVQTRNEEIFRWKWDLMNAADRHALTAAPEGVNLRIPLNATYQPEFGVNYNGIQLDLYSQLSDVEFVAWVMQRMAVRPRDFRRQVAALFLPSQPQYAVVTPAEINATVDVAA